MAYAVPSEKISTSVYLINVHEVPFNTYNHSKSLADVIVLQTEYGNLNIQHQQYYFGY